MSVQLSLTMLSRLSEHIRGQIFALRHGFSSIPRSSSLQTAQMTRHLAGYVPAQQSASRCFF
eukprot:1157323-Pelagomonas_calceolata.AAC.4